MLHWLGCRDSNPNYLIQSSLFGSPLPSSVVHLVPIYCDFGSRSSTSVQFYTAIRRSFWLSSLRPIAFTLCTHIQRASVRSAVGTKYVPSRRRLLGRSECIATEITDGNAVALRRNAHQLENKGSKKPPACQYHVCMRLGWIPVENGTKICEPDHVVNELLDCEDCIRPRFKRPDADLFAPSWIHHKDFFTIRHFTGVDPSQYVQRSAKTTRVIHPSLNRLQEHGVVHFRKFDIRITDAHWATPLEPTLEARLLARRVRTRISMFTYAKHPPLASESKHILIVAVTQSCKSVEQSWSKFALDRAGSVGKNLPHQVAVNKLNVNWNVPATGRKDGIHERPSLGHETAVKPFDWGKCSRSDHIVIIFGISILVQCLHDGVIGPTWSGEFFPKGGKREAGKRWRAAASLSNGRCRASLEYLPIEGIRNGCGRKASWRGSART